MNVKRINNQIVKDFLELQERLPLVIETYQISIKYIIDNIDMSKPTFYSKMKNKSFTASELIQICDIINK